MLIQNSEHIYYGPASFPAGGETFHLKSGKSFPLRVNPGVYVEADDGSHWEYRGPDCNNELSVKGWRLVKEGSCYTAEYLRGRKAREERQKR